MSLTVVGSIAFDSVRTPFGERERMLGRLRRPLLARRELLHRGARRSARSATTSATSEFDGAARAAASITDDIERVAGGETFFWRGHYEYDLNVAHTDDTQLSVFGEFEPKLSDGLARRPTSSSSPTSSPTCSARCARQCGGARFAALDSMNLWIDTARDSLLAAIAEVDCVILNDAEIRQLTGEPNLARAARAVMEMGPRVVVAKQGEYGAALFTEDGFFALPGFPLEDVRDPTGAGDSFAGGFLGYLDGHERRARRRRPAPGDGLRLGARLLQRRGVRHRAGRRASPARRSTSASSGSAR